MSASTPVERWLAILDAAVSSPIRRQIHPEGLPEDPSGEIVRKARLAAGSLPALAPMLGLPMPPPPKPLPSARPPRPPRPMARTPRQAVATGAMANLGARTDAALAEAPKDEAPAEAPATSEHGLPEAPADALTEAPSELEDSAGEASPGTSVDDALAEAELDEAPPVSADSPS